MTLKETQSLPHGIYRIYWKEEYGGGHSLAAVGSLNDGSKWIACTNWIGKEQVNSSGEEIWNKVAEAKLINY